MAFSPYDIDLNGTAVKQIQNLTHNTNAGVINAFASGEVAPAAIYQGDSPQSSSLTSTDLATLLGLNTNTFIANGLCVSAATVTVPFRKRADCGTYAAGASHSAIQCSNTVITPDSIRGALGESATLDATLRYKATSGFTSPVTFVGSQTLATATLNGEYILHSVVINGTAVPELQGVTITPGIQVAEQKSGGGPFSTAFFLNERVPTIEVTTEDLETAGAIVNAASLGTGVDVYFAKRVSGGIIDLPTNTTHIKVSAASGLRQAITMGGDARSNSTGSLRINPFALTAAIGVALP